MERHAGIAGLDGRDRRRDAPQLRQGGGAAVECRDQVPILDIVAEGVEPDLGCLEQHFGCADQPRRVVDQADRGQRRRVGRGTAARPAAPRAPRPSRTAARWCGCRPARLRDQRGLDPGRGERDCGGQPRGAAPDHSDFATVCRSMPPYVVNPLGRMTNLNSASRANALGTGHVTCANCRAPRNARACTAAAARHRLHRAAGRGRVDLPRTGAVEQRHRFSTAICRPSFGSAGPGASRKPVLSSPCGARWRSP